MSEKPIIFSAESVRATLAGRKTETRRVVRPQPPDWFDRSHVLDKPRHPGIEAAMKRYGVPGDRLWVRETLEQYWEGDVGYHTIRYACDKQDVETDAPESWDYGGPRQRCILHDACTQTIPSIHMPKWAARLWLEVVEVRVERVQNITEKDARAEGAEKILHPYHVACAVVGVRTLPRPRRNSRDGFRLLWDRINGQRKILFRWTDDATGIVHSEWVPANYGWDENPWVWVIRFKRSEA